MADAQAEAVALPAVRRTHPLSTARARARYRLIMIGLLVAAVVLGGLMLGWDNPMPLGSREWWLIARMRVSDLVVIALVTLCHSAATVAFQTVAANRIITPSIMGFEALYRLVQTSAVFLLGASAVISLDGVGAYVAIIVVMVGFSALLYGTLLSGRLGNLHIMLLVGIVLGSAMGGIATFMQRTLTPSEFDVLTAQLIGSISNADDSYLPIALPIAVLAAGLLWLMSPVLNVMSLGRDTATNLGVHHKRWLIVVLLLVSLLMAVSTATVGPMTFLGFLVAMIAYQLADTYDHRRLLPLAWLIGFVTLCGAYVVLKHVFYAAGSINVIVEIVGGLFFLIYILRKGRL